MSDKHQENEHTIDTLSDPERMREGVDQDMDEYDAFTAIQDEINNNQASFEDDEEDVTSESESDVVDPSIEEGKSQVEDNFEQLLNQVTPTTLDTEPAEGVNDDSEQWMQAERPIDKQEEDVEALPPSDDTEEAPTELSDAGEQTPESLPFYLTTKFFAVVGVIILISLGLLVMTIVDDLSAGDEKPTGNTMGGQVGTVQSPPTELALPVSEVNTSESMDTPTGEALWNGVAISTQKDTNDYTDSDPITRDRIRNLQSQLTDMTMRLDRANQQIDIKDTEIQSALKERDSALSTIASQKQDIVKVTERWEQEIEKSRLLQNAIAKAENEITTLRTDLATEKKLTLREKQGREVAEQRYSELLASQSKEFIELKNSVSSLGERFDDVVAERELQQAKKYLAELSLIEVDQDSGIGRFAVIKNGKVTKPITLRQGEELKGRGIVSRIDPYGCIVFADGESYEPLNGYCP